MASSDSSLPLFDEWRQDFGGRVSRWDYVSQKGGPTLAVAFGSLYWPTFVEVEGCVLLAEHYRPDTFRDWRDRLGDRPDEIERVVNHLHLWDLFDPDEERVPEERLQELAIVLANTWSAALTAQFPLLTADARVMGSPEEYGPTLTISVVRSVSALCGRSAPRSK